MGRAARHHGDARSLNRHTGGFYPTAGGVEIAQIFDRGERAFQPFPRLGGLIGIARNRDAGGFQTPFGQGPIRLGAGGGAVGFSHTRISGPAGIARHLVSAGQIGKAGLQRDMGLGSPFGAGSDLFKIALQLGQLVELLQAQGRSRGRVFGPCAETVPAPEITLAADKALPGLQKGLQARAVFAVNKPNLAKATGQNARAFDKPGQGRNTIR